MATEVAIIVRLVFPRNERKEFEISLPLKKHELPPALWKETDDHVAGLFNRVGDTATFEFTGPSSQRDAMSEGVPCY